MRIKGRIHSGVKHHGDELRFFRTILDELYLRLSELHAMRRFPDTFARMVYIGTVHEVPSPLKDELQGLRKLLNAAAHGNHPHPVTVTDFRSALKVLVEGIAHFTLAAVPHIVLDAYQGKHTESLIRPPHNDYESVEFDRCVVVDKLQVPNAEDWILTCESSGELGRYSLRLKNASKPNNYQFGEDFTQLGPMVWPYVTLHVFNISQRKGARGDFHTYHETMIVLEPDFLVDVSIVSKCYLESKNRAFESSRLNLVVNGKWGFLRKFLNVSPNKNLMLGNLASTILDAHLTKKKVDWDAEIKDFMRKNIWDGMKLGATICREIKDSALNQHLKNITVLPKPRSEDKVRLEPTFFSSKYGIQGRLDYLKEFGNPMNMKDILELKSGKPPANSPLPAPEHQMQTIGYHLLLRSTYGNSVVTTTGVLYSKADQYPIRDVPPTPKLEQHFNMARNAYVNEVFLLSKGDDSLLRMIGMPAFGPTSTYPNVIADMQNLQQSLRGCDALEYSFILEYTAFILRELIHQKIGQNNRGNGGNPGFSSLWMLDFQQKQATFSIMSHLQFDALKSKGQDLVLLRDMSMQEHSSFREGDSVLLYPQEPDEVGALKHQVLKGGIRAVRTNGVEIHLNNPQVNLNYFLEHKHWCLERDFLESSLYSLAQSTLSFCRFPAHRRNRYLGRVSPRFSKNPPIDLEQLVEKKFQNSQQAAIMAALAAEDLMLIQGPPGTGKTSRVLSEIVHQTYKNTSGTTFILAFTNKAVKKVLECLDELNLTNPELKMQVIKLTSDESDPHGLAQLAANRNYNEVRSVLLKTRVFVATINSYLRLEGNLPPEIPRNTLILDEASQVLEHQMAGILPAFDKCIMIGDHKQLPGIVTQPEVDCFAQSEALISHGFYDLRRSIFERFWNQAEKNARGTGEDAEAWGKCMLMLREHFRMHEEIANLVNENYRNQLILGNPERQQSPLPKSPGLTGLANLLASHRVLFIDSPQSEEDRVNVVEAARVKRIVAELESLEKGTANGGKALGIVTPWKAQINAIVRALGDTKSDDLDVDTVERFQGSERKNIVLSLATSTQVLLGVLTSSIYKDGDLEIDRKLNVSISRAEERLIILGDASVLDGSEHYRKLIKRIKDKGGYISNEVAEILFDEKTVTK